MNVSLERVCDQAQRLLRSGAPELRGEGGLNRRARQPHPWGDGELIERGREREQDRGGEDIMLGGSLAEALITNIPASKAQLMELREVKRGEQGLAL